MRKGYLCSPFLLRIPILIMAVITATTIEEEQESLKQEIIKGKFRTSR